MTREEAKELLPIIQAFAEGKTIQYKSEHGEWMETDCPIWAKCSKYRIKPEPKYRPFNTREECWKEMLKHQPLGWVIRDFDKEYTNIITVNDDKSNSNAPVSIGLYGDLKFRAIDLFKAYKFVDGTPFGIEKE